MADKLVKQTAENKTAKNEKETNEINNVPAIQKVEILSKVSDDLSKVADDLASTSLPEVIEMDEIYTRVKKGLASSGMGYLFSAAR